MPVVPLTIIISLCLAFSFVMFFLREHSRGRLGSAERDSLLPFAEEGARLARVGKAAPADLAGGCGCDDGSRPPCAGCARRSA